MPKKIPFETGMLDLMTAMKNRAIGGPDAVKGRDDVFNDKFESIVVDTVCPFDTGVWETGVDRDDAGFQIVEQYESRDKAEVGHKVWVARLKADRNVVLPDIVVWE